MTPQEVLEKAIVSGVFLYVQDETLKYRAKSGALSAELKSELARHRAQIVRHLSQVQAGTKDGSFVPPPLLRRAAGAAVPLSYAQQRLWFIDRLGNGSGQYHAQSAHRLSGRVNIEALRRALSTIIERHESLRTVVAEENGTPYQVVLAHSELDLVQTDLSALAEEEQELAIGRLIADASARPFDLGRDLMLRVHLLYLGPEKYVVQLDLHHIAADAWSLAILQRELLALYQAYCEGLDNPLPPLKLQYADYTMWQRGWLEGEPLARQLQFWKKELADAPEVHRLPLDRERPARPSHAGGAVRCKIGRETLEAIRAACKRYDVTLFMFLHSAMSILLSRYSDETDVVMGMPVAGRVHPELESLIGLFVNTVVLRARLDGNPRFVDLLARDKQSLLDALTHQHVPFEMVVEELKPRRTTSHSPLFQTLFNMQPAEPVRFALPGATFEAVSGGSRKSKFDLVFNIIESASELTLNFVYSTELFLPSTIERMVANFRVLLASILEAPETRIGDLDLLAQPERDRLVRTLNEGRAETVYIVDGDGRLMPEGAVGEICLSETLRRTGELGRWSPQGELQVVGRVEDRIAVSGIRVDLAGVRAMLEAVPWFAKFALTPRRDHAGRELLAVFVESASPERRRVDQLRNSLAAVLDVQQVPFALIPVERIGGTEELVLPEDAAAFQDEPREPTTEIEERMLRLWRSVLPGNELGIADNFFGAGGHSLSMIVLIKRMAKEFGVDIPLATFIESPTIQATARLVDEAEKKSADLIPALSDQQRGRPLPLSFAQQRIWLLTRFEEGSSSYNIPASLRFTGPLDRESLRRAFETIVARHAILRTVYREEAQQPVQVILPPGRFDLPLIDLTAPAPEEQASRVREIARAEAVRPFDLTAESSLRVVLLALAPESHVLLFNVHHIAADGWSIGVLTRELNAIYGAYRQGNAHSLPAPRIQYCDYAVWQREWLSDTVLEEHLGFWKNRLSGIPKVHNLPLDRPRPASESHRGGHYAMKIEGAVVRGLDELGRSCNATPFMILQAALAVLLHRYSGDDDVVIGAPVANRLQSDVEPLVGCFVNTLVLRSDLASNPRFVDFLAATNESLLQAFAHQSVPFELLVEQLNPERDLSHAPLVQVMFAFQSYEGEGIELTDLKFKRAESDYPVSKFDLTLYARLTGDRLSLTWEYAIDIFNASTVESIGSSFVALLKSIVGRPEERVDALPLLTPEAERQLLGNGSGMPADIATLRCIHELFEARARELPGAVAVRRGERLLTYDQLNRAANRLARALRNRGLRTGALVGIFAERSLETIVGLLGILKAGGAYLPLDAANPAERVRALIADAGVDFVVASRQARDSLPLDAQSLVSLDDLLESDDSRREVDEDLSSAELRIGPESLAYVMYTSGSTGQPKGVAVPHRGVTRLVCQPDYIPLGPETVTLQHAPMSFDASTFEIWAALLNGGTLVLLQGAAVDVTNIARHVESYGVNALWLTIGMLPLWIDQHTARLGIRHFLTGGDVVQPRLIEAIYDRDPAITVIHVYGPTENTTFSSFYWVPRGPRQTAALPIGTPIRGSSAYVLDRSMQLLPVGCRGELYVGGAGVAKGYLGNPSLTNERFVPNPFSSDSAERLYKTGDMVRWLPDGTLEFLGRNDQQVKLRGFRVELGEIESHLARVSGVSDCVVVARDTQSVGRQLVAYVIASPSAAEDLDEECRRRLRDALPEYMIPSAYVLLDRLPLTPNGKIDRRALPAPAESDLRKRELAPPRTETEQRIANLWQELLQLGEIGIDDNFFALGGHSLLAFRFISSVREWSGTEVPMRVVFEKPTIREFAAWFDIYEAASVEAIAAADGEEMFL